MFSEDIFIINTIDNVCIACYDNFCMKISEIYKFQKKVSGRLKENDHVIVVSTNYF